MQRDINKVMKGNYCDDNKRCGHACVCRLHFGSSRLLTHIAFGVQEKNNNSSDMYARAREGNILTVVPASHYFLWMVFNKDAVRQKTYLLLEKMLPVFLRTLRGILDLDVIVSFFVVVQFCIIFQQLNFFCILKKKKKKPLHTSYPFCADKYTIHAFSYQFCNFSIHAVHFQHYLITPQFKPLYKSVTITHQTSMKPRRRKLSKTWATLLLLPGESDGPADAHKRSY